MANLCKHGLPAEYPCRACLREGIPQGGRPSCEGTPAAAATGETGNDRPAAPAPLPSNPVVSALHLLEGQTKSPVHAETARRARNEIEKLTRELELRKYASQQADARRAERDRLQSVLGAHVAELLEDRDRLRAAIRETMLADVPDGRDGNVWLRQRLAEVLAGSPNAAQSPEAEGSSKIGHNKIVQGFQTVMARLADLLDSDHFNNIEAIALEAGLPYPPMLTTETPSSETPGDGRGPNGECPVCGEVGSCKAGCADGTDGPL